MSSEDRMTWGEISENKRESYREYAMLLIGRGYYDPTQDVEQLAQHLYKHSPKLKKYRLGDKLY